VRIQIGLRFNENDLIANIDAVESFHLRVEIEVETLGINDRIHDGGISLPGKDASGDVVLGIFKSALPHQGIETDHCIGVGGFALFPDFYSLTFQYLRCSVFGWSGCVGRVLGLKQAREESDGRPGQEEIHAYILRVIGYESSRDFWQNSFMGNA